MRYAAGTEVTYIDRSGYARVASLGDQMEGLGFLGLHEIQPGLPTRIATGDWVIDAGANVGLVTGPLCRMVGASGRVWAFEPLPRNVARLNEFRQMNDVKQLTIFPGGLSSETGRMTLSLGPEGRSGWSSFTKTWGEKQSLEVPTWRLDDLVFETPPDRRVRLIKIDVEGFEPWVLRGAERTLREMQPTVVCEFNDILLRDAGSSSRALLDAFEAFGYMVAAESRQLERELDGGVHDLVLEPANWR